MRAMTAKKYPPKERRTTPSRCSWWSRDSTRAWSASAPTLPPCRTNMSECAGKEVTEPTPQPAEPAETAPEKSANGAGLVVVVLLLLLGGGGALYWFKLRKPKADTRGADDLDDYDYGEDEEDEDYEFEDENTADSEEDKNQ